MVRAALVLLASAVATAVASGSSGQHPLARLTSAEPVNATTSRGAAAANWCSEPAPGDRQATEPGPAVHVVYAIPFDATDALAAVGPQAEAAARSVERWWRREDARRSPRFDRHRASCGPELDVTTVRLVQPTRWYERRTEVGSAIVDGVASARLVRDYLVTLVLYDGPGGRQDVCGEGGRTAGRRGVGIVYLDACAGVPLDRVVAHELLHALAPLPTGAPHACAGDEDHVCDDPTDVLAPTAGGAALADLRLDRGRDDYYGHGRSAPDLRESVYLRRLGERTSQLTVRVRGSGTVSGPVPGTTCGRRCVTSWDILMKVPLAARPGRGHRFVRWEGACTGARGCTAALGRAPVSVTAVFAPPTFRFGVVVAGRGTVRLGDRSTCRSTCVRGVASFSRLRLEAHAAPGWRLAGWSSPCRGSRPICTIAVERPMSVRVSFVETGA